MTDGAAGCAGPFPGGRTLAFGRTSAPMMPQTVQTMRGPKDGTGTVSA